MEIEYYQKENKNGILYKYAKFNGIIFSAGKASEDNKYYRSKKYGKLHRYIYQYYNPDVNIEGYHIHHMDHNPLNNVIDNLVLLTLSEHSKLHMTGKPSCNKDKKRSEESRKKQAEANKGEKNPMYGKKPWNYIEPTKEMIEDVKNKITLDNFCKKYKGIAKRRVWEKIRKQIKTNQIKAN